VYQGKRRRLAEISLITGQSASATIRAYSQRRRITLGLHPKNLTGRVVPMSKGEEKKRAPRRGLAGVGPSANEESTHPGKMPGSCRW